MANITSKIAQIRQAVYGKDVRENIASGIEAINTEVIDTTDRQDGLEATFENLIIDAGNSNAEIVAARYDNVNNRNHATVGERLDEVNSSLADIAIDIKTFGAKGDGVTNDTTAIQNAIDYANSIGGATVIVPPSSNPYIFTMLTVKPNVTFKGTGGILKLNNNTCINSATTYYLIHNQDGLGGFFENVTIDGIKIDGNKANNTSFTVADGITIGGENCRVVNCDVVNAPDSGIMFSKAKNGACLNNRVDAGTDIGIYVNDGDGTTHYDNVVAENRITNFPNGGIALKRICQRTIISLNTIYNCGNGITLENASTSTDFSKNVTIALNRLRRIGYNGGNGRAINLRCSDYSNVFGNVIEDCYGYNIFIEGSSYCNVNGNIINCKNTANTTESIGIYVVDRNSLGCNYNNINDNIITNPLYRGIWISGTVASQFNNISRNKVVGAGNRGMRIDAVWKNNIITENTLGGLYDLEMNASATDNLMKDNILLTNTVTAQADQRNRTSVLNILNATTSKNNIVSSSLNGIPTTGTWNKEDIVLNMNTVIQGTAGSQYIVFGWKRLTTGSGHVLNTDWVEMRSPIGI